jgi:hypothetical protein
MPKRSPNPAPSRQRTSKARQPPGAAQNRPYQRLLARGAL